MSGDLNLAIVSGRIGSVDELKQIGEQALLNFTVASNRYGGKDDAGNAKQATTWHRVSVWGKQAEALQRLLGVGKQVALEGNIRNDTREDAEGNKRTFSGITAYNVRVMGDKEKGAGRQPPSGPGDAGESGVDDPATADPFAIPY